MSRSKEDPALSEKTLKSLFKVKRAIYETNDVEDSQVTIHKVEKKVIYVVVTEFKLVCTLLLNGVMQWENRIEKIVRDKYTTSIIDR